MEEKIYHVDFDTLESFMRDALIGALEALAHEEILELEV